VSRTNCNYFHYLFPSLLTAGMDLAGQVGVTHFYHFFYEGCLTNFEIGEEGEEASKLYPDVKYTRMDEYLKLYL
jgi:hypothetical protein